MKPSPDTASTLALAHALRTPLTSLTLGLGLLQDGGLGPLNEAQREVVHVLVEELARLSLLVEQELRLDHLGAHAGPVERTRADLAHLVEQASAPLAEQAAARSVDLHLDLEPGVHAVVDEQKMTWVVASLLGNALRYSPQRGRVLVRVRRDEPDAELAIVDEGPGMAPEVADRVFERGKGLGLFLVREIVEAHGGAIRVEPAPGRGSAFVIRLPLEDP
jgi:signal transduction histidine kinase